MTSLAVRRDRRSADIRALSLDEIDRVAGGTVMPVVGAIFTAVKAVIGGSSGSRTTTTTTYYDSQGRVVRVVTTTTDD